MEHTDLVIIGAGIIGLAAAARLSKTMQTVVLERHDSFGRETSSRNSEVIHAGIYYAADTLKTRLCVRGRHLLYEFCDTHRIPHRRIGKLIIANTDREIASMTGQPVLLAYRYVGNNVSIPLTIKKHGEVPVLVTVGDSVLYTIMQLNDGRRMTRAVFSIRNNRNQFLRMKMPSEAEIWSASVGGKNVSPAKDAAGNVLIPLVRSIRTSSELAAFPVELVYVETPSKVVPANFAGSIST